MIKVMIADDQELIRQSLQIVLSIHEDFSGRSEKRVVENHFVEYLFYFSGSI